jgi:hypothetical protein
VFPKLANVAAANAARAKSLVNILGTLNLLYNEVLRPYVAKITIVTPGYTTDPALKDGTYTKISSFKDQLPVEKYSVTSECSINYPAVSQ